MEKALLYSQVRANSYSAIPHWVRDYKVIKKVPETFNHLERLFNQGMISKDVMKRWHKVLFPKVNFPSWITHGGENERLLPSDVGCLFCEYENGKSQIIFPCVGHREERGIFKCATGRVEVDATRLCSEVVGLMSEKKTKEEWRLLNDYFPYEIGPGGIKTNLDIGTLLFTLEQEGFFDSDGCNCDKLVLILDLLDFHCGSKNQLITGIILTVCGVTYSRVACQCIIDRHMLFSCEDIWVDYQKPFHDSVRKSRCWGDKPLFDEDVSNLLYWHLLHGRSGSNADIWEDEAIKRTYEIPPLKDSLSGDVLGESEFFKRQLDEIFDKNFSKDAVVDETFDEHFKKRYEWVAGGSAPGCSSFLSHSDLVSLVDGEADSKDRPRANKRSVCEYLDSSYVTQYIGKYCRNVAKGQIKQNELGGKVRAIYNVELPHFLAFDYICSDIERGLRVEGLNLNEKPGVGMRDLMKRREWCKDRRALNSYDYPDFNIFHTQRSMFELYDSMKRVYLPSLKNESLGDKLKFCDWCAESNLEQGFVSEDGERFYNVGGTLFSGRRDTTIVNTILNYVYNHNINFGVLKEFGLEGSLGGYYHGDDLCSLFNDYVSILYWDSYAVQNGFSANDLKLLSDYGYCEFLRLLYFPSGQVLGSCVRAIASYINGNWESEVDRDPVSRASSLWDQFGVLFRRGLDQKLCNALFSEALSYWSPVLNKNQISSPLPMSYILLSKEDGGMGLCRFGERGKRYRIEPALKVELIRIKSSYKRVGGRHVFSEDGVKLKMSSDYLESVLEEGKKFIYMRSDDKVLAINTLAESSVGSEIPKRFNILDYSVEWYEWLAKNITPDALVEEEVLGREIRDLSVDHDDSHSISRSKFDRIKLLIPFLSPKKGLSKTEALGKWLGIEESEIKFLIFEDQNTIDRVDGGEVSSLGYSNYLRYCCDFSLSCDEGCKVMMEHLEKNAEWIADIRF